MIPGPNVERLRLRDSYRLAAIVRRQRRNPMTFHETSSATDQRMAYYRYGSVGVTPPLHVSLITRHCPFVWLGLWSLKRRKTGIGFPNSGSVAFSISGSSKWVLLASARSCVSL